MVRSGNTVRLSLANWIVFLVFGCIPLIFVWRWTDNSTRVAADNTRAIQSLVKSMESVEKRLLAIESVLLGGKKVDPDEKSHAVR